MALNDYIITYSSTDDASTTGAFSKPAFVVSERSTNTSDTSLTLIGKYSLTSGAELQTSLVHLLENHARDTPPPNPTIGQTWFDTNAKLLKAYTPIPTGARWVAVGSSSTDVSTLPIASFSTLGAIKIGDPFEVTESGVLTLPDIVHISQDLIAKTTAEYIFTSKVTVTGALNSGSPDNFILDDPTLPAEWFVGSFITKGYADRIYAKINTNDPNAAVMPSASKNTVGGVIVGTPFALADNGMISLPNMYFNNATTAKPTGEYNINASLLTSSAAYSIDGNNFIGIDPTKTSADYACYFTTKGYIEDHFIRKGDMSVIYNLPTANNVELGGVIARPPIIANTQGVLSLSSVTYDGTLFAYTFDADINAKKLSTSGKATFNEIVETKKSIYSFDNDNFISKDPTKTAADYNNFFVTKHYADSRYFLDPNAGTSNVGVRPNVATATQIGGVIPGKPFTVSSTGALTIPNMEYSAGTTVTGEDTVPGGSNTPSLEFKSKVKMSGIVFSSIEDNGIFADPSKSDTFYDSYFTTKKFNDDHYLAGGDVFVTGTISKSTYVIEYAPGFSQSEFEGKDNALVNKKYVDSLTQTTSIGPTSTSVFPEDSIITTKNGVLSSISGFAFDPTSGEIKTSKASLVSTATDDAQSALTVYNDQPSATAGSSISLCASEPVPPIIPGQTPTAKPAINSTTKLGAVKLGGWNGTATVTGATIESHSTETWSPTANGTNLVLKVTKKGTNTAVPAMIINDDRSIQIYQGFIETINNTTNATWSVDFSTGSIQVLTTSDHTTITMPSVAEFTGRSITMVIKYTGTHTISWAGGAVSWPDNNAAPLTTSAAGATDVFMFFGDSTKIYGSTAGLSYVQ
jgi:hypothetical protein